MRDGSDGAPRCAVLVGPYLSGKTKLFEGLLASGETAARKAGHAPATGELAVGHTSFMGEPWALIDCPGSIEFAQEARNALMAADIGALERIFADDYVQYDPSGQPLTKQQVLENLRTSTVRYPSIVSTGRSIRIFADFAIVHGSEEDVVEADGRRFSARYLYMDVVVKRNGCWQIVGSLLARPEELPQEP